MSYRIAANNTGGKNSKPALIAMNELAQRNDSNTNSPEFRYVLTVSRLPLVDLHP